MPGPAVADFSAVLGEVLTEIETAGLAQVATDARARCFSAYATSSEWLGAVGETLSTVLRDHGASLPGPTREKLVRCLDEVAKVWPKYRVRSWWNR